MNEQDSQDALNWMLSEEEFINQNREIMTEKTKLITAFIAAQKQMGDAKKDNTNPYFKSKYADLNSVREACIPLLNSHNIAVLQPIIQKDGKSFVRTILMHESGESLESDVEIVFAKANDAQAQGSGITYARRYGLQSIVNIGAEDDDGNKAANDAKPKDDRKRLAEAIGDDMQEMQQAEHQKNFQRIKGTVELCESIEDLQKLWEEEKKPIAAMKKYASNMYELLLDSKDAMKVKFM